MASKDIKNIKIYSFYTSDYAEFAEYFNKTYTGKGYLEQEKLPILGKENSTSSKPKFWYNNFINTDSNIFDYFVFADIDLTFHNDFDFEEICFENKIGTIYRKQFNYPQRMFNSSLISVPNGLKSFITDYYYNSLLSQIDNVEINANCYLNDKLQIPNKYYWDQVSLYETLKKYKWKAINEKIYCNNEVNSYSKILTPNEYRPQIKDDMWKKIKKYVDTKNY